MQGVQSSTDMQKTMGSDSETGITGYLSLLCSTLAVSWLVLSGYALFIYLAGHYGVSRKAVPCFVAWNIQLILMHLAVLLRQREKAKR